MTLLKKIFPKAAFIFLLLMNVAAFAPTYSTAAPVLQPDCPSGTINNGSGVCLPPASNGGGISSSQSLTDLILRLTNILLGLAAITAIFFIVLGGFRYIISGVNEKQAEAGKKTLVNAIIGLVIIIMAYAIVSVVARTVSSSGRNL